MTEPPDALDRNQALVVAFVMKLRDLNDLNPQRLAQIEVPDVESEPCAGARIAVDDAMRTAGTGPAARMRDFAQQAHRLMSKHNFPPGIEGLAHSAIAAILVSNMPGQVRNLATFYAPFERFIPFASLFRPNSDRPT